MGQQQSFSQQVHVAICNSEKDKLNALMAAPEFTAEVIDVQMLVELVQKQWSSDVICKFASLASDDQLASLVATAILHNHVVSLVDIFSKMDAPASTIEKNHLKDLFLTVCDRGNLEAVRALIQYQAYDPLDERPIITVFRTAMRKNHGVDEALLDAVLQALPHHDEAAQYLLDCLPLETKKEEVKILLEGKLKRYISQQ